MRLLLTIALLLSTNPEAKLRLDFEKYKRDTVESLRFHFTRHNECEMRVLVPTIQKTHIYAVQDERKFIRAWCFPQKDSPPYMFVNSKAKWDSRTAKITLIHEAFHLTFVCGEDFNRQPKPTCWLFGRPMFQSHEITEAIKNHFDEWKE